MTDQSASDLSGLSKADRDALRKLELALARRNLQDHTIHPGEVPVEHYAVVHQGKLLGVHEHDRNSGRSPHQTLREKGEAAFPALYGEERPAKPELVKLELASEG